MKTTYRGFELSTQRDKNMGIFYSAVRKSDHHEIVAGLGNDGDTPQKLIKLLKGVVDDYIQDPTAYNVTDAEYGDDCPPDDYDENPLALDIYDESSDFEGIE